MRESNSPNIHTIPALQLVGGPLLSNVGLRQSQVAPGHFEPVAGWPEGSIPKQYGVVVFKRLGNGLFTPLIKLLPQQLKVSEEQGAEQLGCPGVSYQTLLRLRANGFLRGGAISPKSITIEVESWIEHLIAVQDPDFWTPERRQQFARSFAA